MKKIMLPLLAVVLAISFSAFTGLENKRTDPVYYQHGGDWVLFEGEPCPGNQIDECIKSTPDGDKQLFYNQDPGDPVYRNLP